ncbi:hypothetical protein EMIHUDRAFT_440051 [Emiliania huxleyi CCMP1516]|uniref:Fe2OG dioxygenase domain-containing protein n=2 Tax=Emiliania huxleyi TaxID=2903 RepID=A0A0D3KS02_EMIH1|nr:hypothetical protein EMIHUDRAFT_440051 [Emiliania huxleyi CCMP1516]EOD38537.1 hypothetical protein EMIHUDRAFT_440051 [Emiliania huxleyi CCMP1516]|eukprot:XP_005790966.1 hypothetical protein EMIHUDRAFT_440051 [Emiliania huxleyi CCMP1516]
MLSLGLASAAYSSSSDLAQPTVPTERLSSSPDIWLTKGFLSPAEVKHLRTKVPADEAAYAPCIGQVDEFESKRCAFVPVAGDPLAEALVARLGEAWRVDTSRLVAAGLPLIRYLPGAPPVGKHGDEDRHGVVPNATLVLYLTGSDPAHPAGQTIFPEARRRRSLRPRSAGVAVSPTPGAVLSFSNLDASGAPHPNGRHLVSAVPREAESDRLVLQVPLAHPAGGAPPHAYAEHVSGNKKPGEHEKLHGNAQQKGAYAAAVAAGMSIAVAFMAAKAGKFEAGDAASLEAAARATNEFAADDFKTKAA